LAEAKTENIKKYSSEKFDRCLVLWSLAFFVILVFSISGVALYVLSEPELYYPYRLLSAMELIKAFNPDDFNGTYMLKEAREAIFSKLDRYSGYVEPYELSRLLEDFSGSYGGIGVTINEHEQGLSVLTVREDGPADRAGIRTGDIIIKIDDRSLTDMDKSRGGYSLRGEEGTQVKVTAARNNFGDTLQFELTRENLKLIHIPYAGLTENNFLYIRILDFEAGLSEEFSNILDTLYEHRESEIKGIILDVRGNPGGLLHEAVAVCDLFLDKGTLIVGVKGRSRWTGREYFSTEGDFFNGKPVAILVDHGSASAAEILAGALKYSDRAILVGDTTYGKGLVQEYDYLYDGSGIRLTTARYYFKGDIYLNNPDSTGLDIAAGISPDYYIKGVEYEPFPLALEYSQLMRTFAVDNSEEILALAPFAQPPPQWFNRFVDFARSENFRFESDLTTTAKFIRDEVVYFNHSDEVFHAIDNICRLADNDDKKRFEKYQDYIKQRLYQLAIEATYGRAHAYRKAIVPYRPDIFLAEKIITGEDIN